MVLPLRCSVSAFTPKPAGPSAIATSVAAAWSGAGVNQPKTSPLPTTVVAHTAPLPGTVAADALGLAITHAHAGTAMARVGQVTQLSRRQHAMYKGGRSY